jgi:two-component system, OmpR family, sensor kinase
MRLRTKISVVVFAAMLASFAVTAVAVIPAAKRLLIERVDRRLLDDAQAIRNAVTITDTTVVLPTDGTAGLRVGFSDYLVEVSDRRDNSLTLLRASGGAGSNDPVPPPSNIDSDGDEGTVQWANGAGSFLYRTTTVPIDANRTLVVAAPTGDLGTLADELARLFVISGLGSTALVAALGWWWVRRTTKPIEELIERADRIADGHDERTLMTSSSTTEITQLSHALNAMLATVDESLAARTAAVARLREFIADASHELRTPLTSIHGYLQLDLDGALNDHQQHHNAMKRAVGEAERMRRLIGDMQVLSDLDDGRAEPPADQHAVVDFANIVRDCVLDAANLDGARNWELEATHDTMMVSGNEDQLRQVVANLTTNATHHTPSGTTVNVSLSTHDGQAQLVIADNGPGLSTLDCERVFDRFWRADSSRSRATGGSGLGLSIVSALVERHHGTVSAAPRPGGGLAVTVELPLAQPPESPGRSGRPRHVHGVAP